MIDITTINFIWPTLLWLLLCLPLLALLYSVLTLRRNKRNKCN